jgi:ribosomal protein S28E/S33
MMEYKEWEKTAECENIQISRHLGRSVYKTPNGVEIYEGTYIPHNVFAPIRVTQVVILTISEKEKELVAEYGGWLTEAWYGEEDQRWATFSDDMEAAFNFAMEQKEYILENFKSKL